MRVRLIQRALGNRAAPQPGRSLERSWIRANSLVCFPERKSWHGHCIAR